jgi:hypothetical protein
LVSSAAAFSRSPGSLEFGSRSRKCSAAEAMSSEEYLWVIDQVMAVNVDAVAAALSAVVAANEILRLLRIALAGVVRISGIGA